MIYIVTGALGHLGFNIVKHLKDKNKEVRALVRSRAKIEELKALGAQIYYGDITDKESLIPLFNLNGSSKSLVVIHSAGIISISGKYDPYMEKVNVEGTKNILDLSLSKNVKQFVYVSSVHAIKKEPKNNTITETNDYDPKYVKGPYEKTKAAATKLVYEAYLKGNPVTIVFPSAILGPDDYRGGHLNRLVENYLNRKLSSRVSGGYDIVDVRDVASGIYKLTINAHYGDYILSGRYVSLKELFAYLKQVSQRKAFVKVFPKWIIYLADPFIGLYFKLKKKKPLFTAYALKAVSSNGNFSNDKAFKTFGYQPLPLEKTILDTAFWLIKKDRLKNEKTLLALKNIQNN